MGGKVQLRQATVSNDPSMKIDLPPLPYSYTALEPEISKTTLEIHHDKHHAKYVNVANQIKKDFGSFDEFKKQFDTAGNTAFGSGWAWLSWDGSKLVVDKTIGAGNPMTDGKKPILTMDVWEHAYYVDYKNMRATYVTTFLDKLVNWDFVSANFAAAK